MSNQNVETNTPDGFVAKADSPFAESHRKLDEYLRNPESSTLPADSAKFEKAEQMALLCAALERMTFHKQQLRQACQPLTELLKTLAGRKLPYTEEILVQAVGEAATVLMRGEDAGFVSVDSPIPGVVPPLLDGV